MTHRKSIYIPAAFLFLAIILLSLLMPASAYALGGNAPKASENTESSQVVRVFNDAKPSWCTGVLVASNMILTGDHCFQQSEGNWGRVGFGLGGQEKMIGFSEVHLHPVADMALVVMDSPVSNVPAPLATEKAVAFDRGRIYGWGSITHETLGYSDAMVTGEHLVRHTRTGQIFEAFSVQPDGGVLVVGGDSGGPFFIDGAVSGITYASSADRVYGRSIQVAAHSDWLHEMISQRSVSFPVDSTFSGSLGSIGG